MQLLLCKLETVSLNWWCEWVWCLFIVLRDKERGVLNLVRFL